MSARRVLVAGASGYIGLQVVRELAAGGSRVVAFCRAAAAAKLARLANREDLADAIDIRSGDVGDRQSILRDGFRNQGVDAVVSCIASRTGGIADSWSVDYRGNCELLAAAEAAGTSRFVLLSAICVQKPRLEFQRAKLAFEDKLMRSGLAWSIVRPTAYFKSLAGQVPRVRQGKPFLLLGNGDGPACKPISEKDVARFIVACLENRHSCQRVLPIGGPDRAVTVRERAELLFALAGRRPRYRRIPLSVIDASATALAAAARLSPRFADKAEFARIARYYATESMLVYDESTGGYSGDATPSFGNERLSDFYARVLAHGLEGQELGDHALF